MIIPYGNHYKYHSKNAIIFDHIPCCGGACFFTIFFEKIVKFYQKNRIPFFLYYINSFFDQFLLKNMEDATEDILIHVFFGHCCHNIHKIYRTQNRNIYYLTILRDPWKHFLSQYHYSYWKTGKVKDIEQFLYNFQRNFFVKWLGDGSLEKAKNNLENKYYLFGILERFDDFLKMFGYFFNVKDISYSNDLKTRKLGEFTQFKKKFEELHEKDIKLYEWAYKIFDTRFNEISKKDKWSVLVKNKGEQIIDDRYFKEVGVRCENEENVEEKEKFLIKVVQNSFEEFGLLLDFYKQNDISKYISLCEQIAIFLEKNSFLLEFHYYSSSLKEFCLNLKTQIQLNKKNKIEEKEKNEDIVILNIQKKLINNYIANYIKNFEKDKKIGFYGISSRFFIHYYLIKKYIKSCYLFDSDKNKHWEKIDEYIIYPPDYIKVFDIDVIFITSVFWKEILYYLKDIRKRYNLSFKIANLNNFIISWL